MLMSALRQILNMSPALLIDNNIFNSPFGTASDHSSRSKPTPSFSKMMQKALKNKTHNLLEPHHTIVILLFFLYFLIMKVNSDMKSKALAV